MAKANLTHRLIPQHSKVSDAEKKRLFDRLGTDFHQLPKILKTDPAIQHLDIKPGDVIKIIRPSQTAGKAMFYRGVK